MAEHQPSLENRNVPEWQKELRKKLLSKDLPVRDKAAEIEGMLGNVYQSGKRVFLLQGETGSGKSIEGPLILSKFLQKEGLNKKIIVLQPRKDAASDNSKALAALSGKEFGKEVGYSTSEGKTVNPSSEIICVTPGVFLRYLHEGRITKDQLGGVFLDEIHEGSEDYHIILGILKEELDLDFAPFSFLASATINKDQIHNYFGLQEGQYTKIEGRLYTIEKSYQEQVSGSNYTSLAANTVRKICTESGDKDGDILVFMPGAPEITATIREIGTIEGVEVLPLHGQMSAEDRDYVRNGQKKQDIKRRIIVATNIAETSITLPGVTHVVDSCRKKEIKFNPNNGINELVVTHISQAEAEQRAGRAGRVQAGFCHRLLTEEEYKKLDEYPSSEIKRINLENTCLRLLSFGRSPESFRFIEAPDPAQIATGINNLKLIGAVDSEGKLTKIGERLADFPFEPRLGRMVIEALDRDSVEACLVLVGFFRENDARINPGKHDPSVSEKANEKHKKFFTEGKKSDFRWYLNMFSEAVKHGILGAYQDNDNPETLGERESFYRWCKENYLKPEVLKHIAYKIKEYRRYIQKGLWSDRDFTNGYTPLDPVAFIEKLKEISDDDLAALVLSAYPDMLLERYSLRGVATYQTINSQRSVQTHLSPGSVCFSEVPKLCVARKIQTGGSRRGETNYAHDVQPLTVEQIISTFPHLVERTISNKNFNVETGETTVTYEQKFKNPYGNTFSLPESSEVIEDSAMRSEAFAKTLYENPYNISSEFREINNQNKGIVDEFNSFVIRAGGTIPENIPSEEINKEQFLTNWYARKIADIPKETPVTKQTILDNLEAYTLKIDELLPDAKRKLIEKEFPKELLVGKTQCPVEYKKNYTGKYYAVCKIPLQDVFTVTDLSNTIGPDRPLTFTITDSLESPYGILSSSEIELFAVAQDMARKYHIQKQFNTKKSEFPQNEQPVSEFKAENFDLVPLLAPYEFGTDPISKDKLFAYPALQVTGAYQAKWVYYKNKEDADTAQSTAKEKALQYHTEETQKAEWEKTFGQAEQNVQTLREILSAMEYSYSDYNIEYSKYRELKDILEKCQRILGNKNQAEVEFLKQSISQLQLETATAREYKERRDLCIKQAEEAIVKYYSVDPVSGQKFENGSVKLSLDDGRKIKFPYNFDYDEYEKFEVLSEIVTNEGKLVARLVAQKEKDDSVTLSLKQSQDDFRYGYDNQWNQQPFDSLEFIKFAVIATTEAEQEDYSKDVARQAKEYYNEKYKEKYLEDFEYAESQVEAGNWFSGTFKQEQGKHGLQWKCSKKVYGFTNVYVVDYNSEQPTDPRFKYFFSEQFEIAKTNNSRVVVVRLLPPFPENAPSEISTARVENMEEIEIKPGSEGEEVKDIEYLRKELGQLLKNLAIEENPFAELGIKEKIKQNINKILEISDNDKEKVDLTKKLEELSLKKNRR